MHFFILNIGKFTITWIFINKVEYLGCAATGDYSFGGESSGAKNSGNLGISVWFGLLNLNLITWKDVIEY